MCLGEQITVAKLVPMALIFIGALVVQLRSRWSIPVLTHLRNLYMGVSDVISGMIIYSISEVIFNG